MYRTDDVKDILDIKGSTLANLRNGLRKGSDWNIDKHGFYYYPMGVSRLKNLVEEQRSKLKVFIRLIKDFTLCDPIVKSNERNIMIAVVEFLKAKEYSTYEIAKALGVKQYAVEQLSTKCPNDWVYELIEKEVNRIGEEIWQTV